MVELVKSEPLQKVDTFEAVNAIFYSEYLKTAKEKIRTYAAANSIPHIGFGHLVQVLFTPLEAQALVAEMIIKESDRLFDSVETELGEFEEVH